jgi:hypothetical protein
MIRDQVVDGCNSTEQRRKLLAVENLTLDKVRKIARTYELSQSYWILYLCIYSIKYLN